MAIRRAIGRARSHAITWLAQTAPTTITAQPRPTNRKKPILGQKGAASLPNAPMKPRKAATPIESRKGPTA